jgi:hypothetical protein
MTSKNNIKDGGVFYRDITAMHDRAKRALSRAKAIEERRQKIPVRINNHTIILVDAGDDIDCAIFKFKKRYKL